MTHLRAAVVGAGYLGAYHAEKYARCEGARLVAVVDVDRARAEEVAARAAEKAGSPRAAEVFTDYRAILGEVDAVSIAVPTSLHFDVARAFLESGIDVLVEKPITTTVAEADALIALADARGRVLQVGHLERFNPAIVAATAEIARPGFIEAHRLGPFVGRGTDVDVVLDLMIHDLDIILAFARSPVVEVSAVGVPVLSRAVDIANARITFANGCVANVTASRVSMKKTRKIRVFERDSYLSIDYEAQTVDVIHRRFSPQGEAYLDTRQFEIARGDALAEEVRAFVDACRKRAAPVVSGRDGREALALAQAIKDRFDPALVAEALTTPSPGER